MRWGTWMKHFLELEPLDWRQSLSFSGCSRRSVPAMPLCSLLRHHLTSLQCMGCSLILSVLF